MRSGSQQRLEAVLMLTTGEVNVYLDCLPHIPAHESATLQVIITEVGQQQSLGDQKVFDAVFEPKNIDLNPMNTGLKIMVHNKEINQLEVKKEMLAQGIKQETSPFLVQLKKGNQDVKQIALLEILEANLPALSGILRTQPFNSPCFSRINA